MYSLEKLVDTLYGEFHVVTATPTLEDEMSFTEWVQGTFDQMEAGKGARV